MTAVTQCPQCGTRFRVVPDQLKISQGWVRCGKCAEVFNAREALETAAALIAGQPAPVHTGSAPQQVSIVLRQQEPAGTSDVAAPVAHATPSDEPVWQVPAADSSPVPDTAVAVPPDHFGENHVPPWQRHVASHEVPDQVVQPPVASQAPPWAMSPDTAQPLPSWLVRPDLGQRVDCDVDIAETTHAEPVETEAAQNATADTDTPPPWPDALPPMPMAAAVSALQQTVAGWVRSDGLAFAATETATPSTGVAVASAAADAPPIASALTWGTVELAEAVQDAIPAASLDIELPVDPLVPVLPGADWGVRVPGDGLSPPSPSLSVEPRADVGFIRQARRQAAWASGPARAALGALIIFAAALLLLQVAVQERDRLVAMAPALKPWLVQLCEPIGCEIGLFQQIESVEIVSTELVRAKDGTYRFELGLRNLAALPVAMPAVELSLTDRSGDAVVRRVVLPDDWLAAPSVLTPTAETGLTLKMSLVNPDELRMEGFRAIVFYP